MPRGRAGWRISWVRHLCCRCPTAPSGAALGRIATENGALAAAAEELARVLSAGGRAAFAEPGMAAGEELAGALAAAGFERVEVKPVGEEAVVSGRRRLRMREPDGESVSHPRESRHDSVAPGRVR